MNNLDGNKFDFTVKQNYILFALLCCFVFFLSFQKQHWDSDIFWALESGELIVNNLEVPQTDPFSYTFENEKWIDFTWGFQVLSHLFFEYLGGWYGLFVFQVLILFSFIFVLFKLIKHYSDDFMAVTITAVVLFSIQGVLFIRPHILSYFFMMLFMYVLALFGKTRNNKFLLYLLLVQVLWTNTHSSFVLGPFIFGAFVLGSYLDTFLKDGGFKTNSLLKSFSKHFMEHRFDYYMVFGLFLVTVINPYGVELSLFPFVHQGGENYLVLNSITEWQRVPFNTLFLDFTPGNAPILVFKVFFYVIVASVVFRKYEICFYDYIVFCAFLYLAVSHLRFVALFIMVTAIFFSKSVYSLDFYKTVLVSRKKIVFPVLLFFIFSSFAFSVYSLPKGAFGVGVSNGLFPVGSAKFVNYLEFDGNIFNSYNFGGYLVREVDNKKVFIDSRTPTVFTPYHHFKEIGSNSESLWARLVDDYNIEVALASDKSILCSNLMNDPQWRPVFFDDVSVVFTKLKTDSKGDEIREIRNLPLCKPLTTDFKFTSDVLREQSLSDMTYTLGLYDKYTIADEVYRPHLFMGGVYQTYGDSKFDDAISSFERAANISKNNTIYAFIGEVVSKTNFPIDGKIEKAEKYFLKALDSDSDEIKKLLGYFYYNKKDFFKSEKYLREFLDSVGEANVDEETYKILGLSCFKLNRVGCSVEFLERAYFLRPENDSENAISDNSLLAIHLGHLYLDLGKMNKAFSYYNIAYNLDRQYGSVELRRVLKHAVSTGDSIVYERFYKAFPEILETPDKHNDIESKNSHDVSEIEMSTFEKG